MNLKKLPQEEKPRERLLKYGKNNVSNNELIEIILIDERQKEENFLLTILIVKIITLI